MIKLHGFAVSNYYNKVKLALLEKGIPFEEVYCGTKSTDPAVLAASPLAKIPFITTDEGGLCESEVILEYLEDRYPDKPLLPGDPFQRAKVRELCTFVDWHVEMTARQLYAAAFFGAPPLSENNLARIRGELDARLAAFKKMAKFAPYVAGDAFTIADCSALPSLTLVAMATKTVYGEDLVAAAGIDHKAYGKFLAERPAVAKVLADRKAGQSK